MVSCSSTSQSQWIYDLKLWLDVNEEGRWCSPAESFLYLTGEVVSSVTLFIDKEKMCLLLF